MSTFAAAYPHLIARTDDDAGDHSHLYGPQWHAPLPDLQPDMVVKIGLRGPGAAQEWPWGVVTRVMDGLLWVIVDTIAYPHLHDGIESGTEIVIRPEHVHVVSADATKRLHDLKLKGQHPYRSARWSA